MPMVRRGLGAENRLSELNMNILPGLRGGILWTVTDRLR
jgi:hypothetical protein